MVSLLIAYFVSEWRSISALVGASGTSAWLWYHTRWYANKIAFRTITVYGRFCLNIGLYTTASTCARLMQRLNSHLAQLLDTQQA